MPELAVGHEGRELSLGNVQPPLQQIGCVETACWRPAGASREVKVGGLELVSVHPSHSLQRRLHCGHEENEVRKVSNRESVTCGVGPPHPC